ncbi:MAG: hypothetical protein QN229_03815 [Desulfurococcaceae archaeon TW002]
MSKHYMYPFLKKLDEYFRERFGSEVDLAALFTNRTLRDKAVEKVRRALSRKRSKSSGASTVELDEDEYIAFYMGLLVAGFTDVWALKKYVDSEVKNFIELMKLESSKFLWNVSRMLGLSGELLARDDECGYKVVLVSEPKQDISCFQFRLTISKYLTYAERLLGEAGWSLLETYVSGGYVYLPKSKYVRLLEDPLKEYLIKLFDELSVKLTDASVLEDLRSEIAEVIRREYKRSRIEEPGQVSPSEIKEVFFPPCIKELVKSLRVNEHLTHIQRFALATFLLNIGASVNYVLDLMRNAPDFNEKIARYQIEHLAGMKGGGKKYKTYSCAKMKELGMCVAECGVKTPIQYYTRLLRNLKKPGERLSSRNQES